MDEDSMARMQAVLGLETGITLNEHYTFEEYVNRRSGWLGRHPDYARMPTGLFSIARRDAKDVFAADSALSVQEVRRRELARDVDPLLPLPTTENTDSLDNFRSYPDREWSPGVVWAVTQAAADDDKDSAIDTFETLAATSQNPHTLATSQATTNAQYLAHGPSSPSAIPITQTSPTPRSQAANDNPKSLSSQQTSGNQPGRTPRQKSSDYSSHLLPNSSSPMADIASTRATTPMFGQVGAQYGPNPPASNGFGIPRPSLLHGIIEALGQPHQRPATLPEDLVDVDGGIASLSGRGIRVPVKQKRGTKRAASASPTDSVIGSEATEPDHPAEQRPVKRLKLKGPRDPSASPSQEASPTKRSSAPPRSTPTKKPTPMKQKARPSTTNADREFEAVITGAALPTSKAQAKAAAKARHERLLAQHRTTNTSKAGVTKRPHAKGGRKASEPDLLPEFFIPANFAPGEETDSVRCVCGVTADDNALMLSCDGCNVWQHNHCMGSAVPKNPRKAKYLCQMCDPWAHRELLARLRREQAIE